MHGFFFVILEINEKTEDKEEEIYRKKEDKEKK